MPSPTTQQPASSLSQTRDANQALIFALQAHPAFPDQFSAHQGKVYFMWDFAKRTHAMFDSLIDDMPAPDTPATRGSIPTAPPSTMTEGQKKALASDAVGRCMMLQMMMDDQSPMSGIMFGEAPGQEVDLGVDVKTKAKAVVDAIPNPLP